MCVFWEYTEFGETITACFVQDLQADSYRAVYGLVAISLIARVEGYEPLSVEPQIDARDGRWERLAKLECTVKEAVDEFQQQRPLAQAMVSALSSGCWVRT